MKIAIIGAGNMGGAIARGLAKGTLVASEDVFVADPSKESLNKLKAFDDRINVTTNNQEAVNGADWVMIAVKPWLVEEVIKGLQLNIEKQVIISIAAGVTFYNIADLIGDDATIFRLLPNTGISDKASMTLIASRLATQEQNQLMLDIFNEMGLAMLIPENQMGAATALASCGIAYALKYMQAAMQAGVEMGIPPQSAMKMVAQSVKGAAELILNNDTHPSVEIDKVTTPGGYTIKGINELEHAGFTSAIIKAMKVSNPTT
ncbi:pyrroline-5-carboxylate reductase [Bacteroides sp. 214]|uniref:pyrroline-5-carboxylate reductase n=1 Tax=Bacteroides sp. 214 TaxID=2302935 RepID=UPI0013D5F1B1|nr:pyrroline-5-carboxylate reductase [Bacteroides sp. 214]NDW12613.1 pyrroline-5-carboxylate reductase [Bacteroides sp. 214]